MNNNDNNNKKKQQHLDQHMTLSVFISNIYIYISWKYTKM